MVGTRYMMPLRRGYEHNFPELFALFEVGVRRGAFREPECAINVGFQLSCRDQLQHRREFRFRSHVRAENGKLTAEQETYIDFRVIASCRAASHKAPSARQTCNAVVPGRGTNVFKHYV